jgi:hypothetical protein
MVAGDFVVLDAGGELGVDVIVVKGPRPAQGDAEVGVEGVCTPEGSAAALDLDVVEAAGGAWDLVPVETDGEGEIGDGAELAPAVVDAGLGEEVVALEEAGLDAGEADGAAFFGELVLCGEEVSGASHG